MNFIDPYSPDKFEEWLKQQRDEYEKDGKYAYFLVVREVLQKYRSFKENAVDSAKYGGK